METFATLSLLNLTLDGSQAGIVTGVQSESQFRADGVTIQHFKRGGVVAREEVEMSRSKLVNNSGVYGSGLSCVRADVTLTEVGGGGVTDGEVMIG